MIKDRELRKQLLEVCWASGADVNQVAQALVDTLMITLVQLGPDADNAERNLRNITDDMLQNIRTFFSDYHSQIEARRATQQ
jgi:hypothetical protein